MEPSPHRPTVVPRLHLVGVSNDNTQVALPKIESARLPTRPTQIKHDERVSTSRVYESSVTYLDSPILPKLPHKSRSQPNQTTSDSPLSPDEFMILHPSLDVSDANGELSKLMLSQWSIDAGEQAFTSISLFCEMKYSEAKRMTSWIESPNRFLTTVCCQLLDKFIQKLETSPKPFSSHESTTMSRSATFLRKMHTEMINAIYAPNPSNPSYLDQLPYYMEYKKVQNQAQFLKTTIEHRDKHSAMKAQFPVKLNKILTSQLLKANQQQMKMIFRVWANYTRQLNQSRLLKCKAFQSAKRFNLGTIFRGWRIEALRRAYHRESVEYQSMLSITAATISRKDVLIGEAEAKIASMSKVISTLTESNNQLMYRIDQLQLMVGRGGNGVAYYSPSIGQDFHPPPTSPPPVTLEQMDTLLAQDDEKMDRSNRMLLETMFGMARMVESNAIQMSKDLMDSLESQLEGTLLQNLVEMIQADNLAKLRAEELRQQLEVQENRHKLIIASAATSSPQQNRRHSQELLESLQQSTIPSLVIPMTSPLMTIKDLIHMPIDVFLLHWFRMNLQLSTVAERPSDRTIKNFTTDLMDGRRFSFLLHRLFPTWFDIHMAHEPDVEERLLNIASFHTRVQPELPQVVTYDSIHSASATENIAFVAMLFALSITSIRRINLERQRQDYLNILTSWKRVCSLLLEVKKMKENYDSLLIVHLLKEMRTCETLFKQLNTELCTIALTSNETASVLSQVANKALQLTWKCCHAQLSNQLESLDVIDERNAEKIKDFTMIEIGTIRQILSEKDGGIPEKEVQVRMEAIRTILSEYGMILNNIFRYYSTNSGVGSMTRLSRTEFQKFAKDCGLCEKLSKGNQVTSPMIEMVYNATLFYSRFTTRDVALNIVAQAHGAYVAANPTLGIPAFNPSHLTLELMDHLYPYLSFGEREMSPIEFVDALIRIAAFKSNGSSSIEDHFRDLIETCVVPNALYIDTKYFRTELASHSVRMVFQKYKETLQHMFRYYASMHVLRTQTHQVTMEFKEFIIFAKDCKLLGSILTEYTLKQILINVPRDESMEMISSKLYRMDFTHFQEAIAALTSYVICNPYVPFAKRMEQFINEILLPRARQKKKNIGE